MLRKLASRILGPTQTKNDFVRESYAQCGEDLIIDFLFQQLKISKPSYIDIGAHHPRFINNTYLFYLKGARGINIEPDASLFSEFVRWRKEDINLCIGIGEKEDSADFFIMNEPTLNTFMREEAERSVKENPHSKINEVKKTRIRPLRAVIDEYHGGKFPDLLSIDVEGLDEAILRTVNFDGQAPKVLCVETLTFSQTGRGEKKNGTDRVY